MAMKRYKTIYGNLTTFIAVGEETKRVKFVAADNRTGYFETSDTMLQKAVESDINFGVKFFIDEVETHAVSNSESEVEVVECVKSWQEARNFLHAEPYNVPFSELSSPKKILNMALKHGLNFINVAK